VGWSAFSERKNDMPFDAFGPRSGIFDPRSAFPDRRRDPRSPVLVKTIADDVQNGTVAGLNSVSCSGTLRGLIK
jgi:hypothetical protein